jgi:hypothetical protein
MGLSPRGIPEISNNVLYMYAIPFVAVFTIPGNFVDVTD